MNVIIGADLVATKSNAEYFESRRMCELLGDALYNTLHDADYRIFNCAGTGRRRFCSCSL